MRARYFLGIDAGSTASKCVIVDSEGEIAGFGLERSGAGTQGPMLAIQAALDKAGITKDDIERSCSTGYGRNIIEGADLRMSELSCHARGAAVLFPGAHTIVDIGGQDAKVLRVDGAGRLENFVMNDKCAAGTGRFLDVMASVFGCQVGDLAQYDKQAQKISSISSTCTVFAESEVISKLASGETIPDVVAGIHASVAERPYGLMRRAGVQPAVAMTGGVALNDGLRARLEERVGQPIMTSPLAQLNGALGAAHFAREKTPN